MPLSDNKVDIQKYFLPGVLLLLLVFLFLFSAPFVGTIIIAAVIVTGVYPIHKLLHKKLHLPKAISSFISLILVAAIILVPLSLFFILAADEAAGAYQIISDKITFLTEKDISFIPSLLQKGSIGKMINRISEFAPISATDVISVFRDFIGRISSVLLSQSTNILKNLSLFLIHMVVFLLAMFYLLKDGDKLVDYIKGLLPLSEKYRKELFKKLSRLSYGIIYGIFGAAIAQGFLVGVGMAMVGIENTIFWGALAALLSPLPYIGTAIVWVPVVIALAVSGHIVSAIFLLIWGITIVGLADNLIKPYIIGSSNALHPLAVLLVLLGGAFSFGIKGLIFGPFILTLTLSFLHIYQLEYKSVLTRKRKFTRRRKL